MTESRERITIAASQLFLGGSFHKVGIAEICSEAKVNKGTFYHFFPSKIDLLIEVLEHYTREYAAAFAKVAVSKAKATSKLTSVFSILQERSIAWKAAHGVSCGCFIGNVILELASSEPLVRERAEYAIDEVTRSLQPIVAEFLEAENVKDADVPALADVLMGLLQGAQVQAKVRNDPDVFSRYAALAPNMIRGVSTGQQSAFV